MFAREYFSATLPAPETTNHPAAISALKIPGSKKSLPERVSSPSRDHFWLVYTYQLNPPLGAAKTDVQLQSGQPYGCPMTVGVGGVCSLTSEVLVNLNKGVPPPAYFDWRGWFRAGLPFFRDDFEI
ncbi:hypothetical protein J6590_037006 [Homalodisca vitripennis]|nr:hypothetical protein J6590_037006 [Homalodisca vitripennis]